MTAEADVGYGQYVNVRKGHKASLTRWTYVRSGPPVLILWD